MVADNLSPSRQTTANHTQAHACLAEVAEATAKEGGAKIYRFYKTEGKDEFVCMEK